MREDNFLYERYARQLQLPGLGEKGQEKLGQASVLVVGAGGLGSPVIEYLAAAGIGKLGIVDGDRVELSNLHRQLLYTMQDIGEQKATTAAGKVSRLNPQVKCVAYPYSITNKNAAELIREYDIVADCTDNFVTRYVLNDACFLLGKPLVFAAVFQYEGQVTVFNLPPARISYRDLFPEAPDPASVPDCNVAGVLGVLPGLIGLLQATEVIKIITGIGEPLSGKLLNFDIRTSTSITLELNPRGQHQGPSSMTEFEATDYEWFCGATAVTGVDRHQLDNMLHEANTIAIDVREMDELPVAIFPHRRLPFSTFSVVPDLSGFENIIVFCQTGARSLKAAEILKKQYGTTRQVVHLIGGLRAYNQP